MSDARTNGRPQSKIHHDLRIHRARRKPVDRPWNSQKQAVETGDGYQGKLVDRVYSHRYSDKFLVALTQVSHSGVSQVYVMSMSLGIYLQAIAFYNLYFA
uniref:Uncharacterized protein n=1 Tax=Glossina pallidipes TaxID=7398 RepID=A0A1A9Z4J7_GLOPL